VGPDIFIPLLPSEASEAFELANKNIFLDIRFCGAEYNFDVFLCAVRQTVVT